MELVTPLLWKNFAYQPFANILTKNYRSQAVYNADGKTYFDSNSKSQYTLKNDKYWLHDVRDRLYKEVFQGMKGMNHYIMKEFDYGRYIEHVHILISGIKKVLDYYRVIDDHNRYNQWNSYLTLANQIFLRINIAESLDKY
ncbi:MAG: hypothetical protein RSC93_01410 [Erysipelotrichaceae bacterium]